MRRVWMVSLKTGKYNNRILVRITTGLKSSNFRMTHNDRIESIRSIRNSSSQECGVSLDGTHFCVSRSGTY